MSGQDPMPESTASEGKEEREADSKAEKLWQEFYMPDEAQGVAWDVLKKFYALALSLESEVLRLKKEVGETKKHCIGRVEIYAAKIGFRGKCSCGFVGPIVKDMDKVRDSMWISVHPSTPPEAAASV